MNFLLLLEISQQHNLWQMEVFRENSSEDGVDSEYMGIKIFLRSCVRGWNGCWTTAEVKVYTKKTPRHYYGQTSKSYWNSSIPQKLLCGYAICNNKLLKMEDFSVEIHCLLHVYNLDKPIHTGALLPKPSRTVSVPKHSLGQTMEEARQKGLLTDVTLVTGKKEFKAHKLILATQSPFFKTRFEQRWEQSGDRVKLNDISSEILEEVLKYMYMGKVDKIDDKKFVRSLFSVADEYGVEKLRTTCEETLEKTLSDENVVDVLILADTHNAKDLKKMCIEYIIRSPSQVKKSSAWSKFESKESEEIEKLRMEVLEACFNAH